MPRHLAVILDGNGRWAERRGLPRSAGHGAGATAVDRVVEAARRRRIEMVTLFAFSSDNWGRPAREVRGLMDLLASHLATHTRRCAGHGIRLRVIGRRDRLSRRLAAAIAVAEAATAAQRAMELRLAVDYSGRDALLAAAAALAAGPAPTRARFRRALGRATHGGGAVPDVDLLVRTGGEQRLSDFLLWECAYAELYFTDVLWPDFTARDLDRALAWYAGRDRRFGRIAGTAP